MLLDLNTLMTFTFRPYKVDPLIKCFSSGSPSFYLPTNDGPGSATKITTVIIVALYSFPVAVRIIPTSPLVDMILYRVEPSGGRLQVDDMFYINRNRH